MSDDIPRAFLTVKNPYNREVRQNPSFEEVVSEVRRLVTLFPPASGNPTLDPLRRRPHDETLQLFTIGQEPRLNSSALFLFLSAVLAPRFKLVAEVQYRFSEVPHKGATDTYDIDSLIRRFTDLLRGDPIWREGLSWEPQLPPVAPFPPRMFLESDGEYRRRDPIPEEVVSTIRGLKYKYLGDGPIVQLTGYAKGDPEDFEAVRATKLSNVDFSLVYERINQGNTTVHQCTRMPLTAKQIIEVFLSFLQQDNNWKFKLPWSPPFGSEPIIGSSGAPIPHSEDRGVVYLLHAGAHYKIGKTIDSQSRYEALDIQLPWKVERVHEIATNNIHRLERHWHRHFADRRGNGEWFDLTSDDVEEFCSYARTDYK